MTKEQFKREARYRTAMSIAGEMLKMGIISDKEFRQIDAMCAKKYLPVLAGLLPTST